MSGFEPDWLALRESADGRARDSRLLEGFVRIVDGQQGPLILDIGCGTGSTLRALAPFLDKTVRWRLVDSDPRLLAVARDRHDDGHGVEIVQGDLTHLSALPLAGVSAVTASALFDLCSADFVARLADVLSEARLPLYAGLNYDGRMEWSNAHPLDAAVTADFNRHQQSDKGFGAALGPMAAAALADAFTKRGYRVTSAPSPWVMTSGEIRLQAAFLSGLIDPVAEIGTISQEQLREWHRFRIAALDDPSASLTVGHDDVLALPVI